MRVARSHAKSAQPKGKRHQHCAMPALAVTARSLMMQKPDPLPGAAWCVPPAVLTASSPVASASRAVSSVPGSGLAACGRKGGPDRTGIDGGGGELLAAGA
jgi:hypothetical protein